MKVTLRVDAYNKGEHFFAALNVPDILQVAFESYQPHNFEVLASLINNTPLNDTPRMITKIRDDAAEILANRLAKIIVDAMKKSDFINQSTDTGT